MKRTKLERNIKQIPFNMKNPFWHESMGSDAPRELKKKSVHREKKLFPE